MIQSTTRPFGEMLADARREKKFLLPRDLARSANVSESVYRSWEKGDGYPNRLQLTKMFGSNHWIQAHLPKRDSASLAEVVALKGGPRSGGTSAPSFGAALKAERERENLNQDELGALLNPPVTRQAVSAWEVDKQPPVRENLEQLYELFPNLVLASRPSSQDIPMPDGGKGVVRPNLLVVPPPEPVEVAKRAEAPLPVTPSLPTAKFVRQRQLIEYIHTCCTKLHGGTWRIVFGLEEGRWYAIASRWKTGLKYKGLAASIPGGPDDALLALLREVRGEVDRRKRQLDALEMALPEDLP